MAVVILPAATKQFQSESLARPDGWVAMSIYMGTPFGARAQFIPYSGKRVAIGVEGIAGILSSTLGINHSFGGGVRVFLKPYISPDKQHFILVSPGVDFIFLAGDSTKPEGFWAPKWSPYSDIYFVGGTTDVSYLFMAKKHLGIEVGLSGGAAVSVAGERDQNQQDPKGRFIPLLGVFSGIRF
jgi:hypothetical protein